MWIYILCAAFVLFLFSVVKTVVWDKPHEEISQLKADIKHLQGLQDEENTKLKRDIERLQVLHKEEIALLHTRLKNSSSLHIQESEFADIVVSSAWRELAELCNKEYAFLSIPRPYSSLAWEQRQVAEPIKRRFKEAIEEQYKYKYLIYLYPELEKIFQGSTIVAPISAQPTTTSLRTESLFDIVNLLRGGSDTSEQLIYWKNRVAFLEAAKSNLTAIPYMAGIMADYETYGIEHLAKELDWGYAVKRMSKVKAIRDIRKDAQSIVEKNKEAQYQLSYLLTLFPNLEDIIDAEFSQLPVIKVSELSEYDTTRDYLSKSEYESLSITERNQLALDRYKSSRRRTKWQIGRDYELYVGYKYSLKGYDIDYFGSYMGLEDLGRDLIATKGDEILIIQCKYWSAKKQIHENHVNQLFGTLTSYCIERQIGQRTVRGVLVTNIELSPMAKKMASYLDIRYIEHFDIGDYPCIKCNIGRGDYGEPTKIYHLPFDQQYDSTKIKNKGEFFAMTVAEAEAAGFRRAFKWFGQG